MLLEVLAELSTMSCIKNRATSDVQAPQHLTMRERETLCTAPPYKSPCMALFMLAPHTAGANTHNDHRSAMTPYSRLRAVPEPHLQTATVYTLMQAKSCKPSQAK